MHVLAAAAHAEPGSGQQHKFCKQCLHTLACLAYGTISNRATSSFEAHSNALGKQSVQPQLALCVIKQQQRGVQLCASGLIRTAIAANGLLIGTSIPKAGSAAALSMLLLSSLNIQGKYREA